MDIVMDAQSLNAFLATDFPQAGDCRVESVDADRLVARLRVGDRHLRPGGTVGGPSIFALADIAIYCAILSRIGPVALAVTTNASVDFMRKPAAGRDLLAAGTADHLAARLAAAPVDGKANAALIALVAARFGLPRRAVTQVAGDTARLKRLHLAGDGAALAQIAAAL